MSSTFIVGGLKLRDKQYFSWKIENFSAILSHVKAIDAQGFEFRVRENDPKISSRWSIYLKSNENNRDDIGIYYKKVDNCDSNEDIYTECSFAMKNQKNEEVLTSQIKGVFGPLKTLTGEVGPGKFFDCSTLRGLLDTDGCLTIHCTFKLFIKHTRCSLMGTVQGFLEQFHEKSKTEAQSIFAKWSEQKSSFENVKILTMDSVEIQAVKDILAVRSPVFEAMFRSKMKEETEGVIELQDFTADAVRVLLHFIYTGELLPNWSNIDILPQLANAAEKYQFPDLLKLFDCVLPSLCDVHTAKPILHIAVQFRLKKAEEGILQFFGKGFEEEFEKIKSGEELLKALEGISVESGTSDQ